MAGIAPYVNHEVMINRRPTGPAGIRDWTINGIYLIGVFLMHWLFEIEMLE